MASPVSGPVIAAIIVPICIALALLVAILNYYLHLKRRKKLLEILKKDVINESKRSQSNS